MTQAKAKKIGSRQGLISGGLGVLVAQLIMTAFASDSGFFNAFFWFADFSYILNLVVGVAFLLLSGHFYGQLAGKAILIKKRNFVLVGFLTGMAVLMTTAFFAGWTGFFQEGIYKIGSYEDPFNDYILKPLFLITIFGMIPSFVVGIWFGWQIKIKGKKHSTQQ